jgi:hypothetical protein
MRGRMKYRRWHETMKDREWNDIIDKMLTFIADQPMKKLV